jgi:excisionase family DNA binding protein
MKTWLTVAEGAEYAGVSRDTIYTACERRELPHARLGGRRAIRLRREWIDGWLEQHMRGARTDAITPTNPAASARYADGRTERTKTLGAGHTMTAASRQPMCRPPRECHDGC